MFVILLIALTFSQGSAIVSHGNSFITAFPENVAYFYPFTSSRVLRVTALHDNTHLTVFYNNTERTIQIQLRGNVINLMFPKTAEIHQLNYSTNSIRINSTKNVVVHSFSKTDTGIIEEKSIQSHVVQPITNLGTHHLIPSLNQSAFIQTFTGSPASYWPKRYSSFKLIIINAEDTDNTVKVVRNVSSGIQEENFTIPSYQLFQLQASASILMVKSSHKISVMLTHPCLENAFCNCSTIVNPILPIEFQGQNFVVPNISGVFQTRLLVTSETMSTSLFQHNVQLQPGPAGFFSLSNQQGSQFVNASGHASLILINPRIFIEIIPENMFAACYLLPFYSDNSNSRMAVVIAETDSKNEIHMENNLLTNVIWREITGTKYSSVVLPLTTQNTFFWHPSSKIAVYTVDKIGKTVYGGPAIPINDKPDKSGCVVIPGEYEVENETLSWAESLLYCTSFQKQLACLTEEEVQMELANEVEATNDEDAWIGLRRSLMTSEWYWQKQAPASSSSSSSSLSLDYVHWADGQPQDKSKGLCASLSLDGEDEFKWKTTKCCERKRPVCYKPPTVLSSLSSVQTEITF